MLRVLGGNTRCTRSNAEGGVRNEGGRGGGGCNSAMCPAESALTSYIALVPPAS